MSIIQTIRHRLKLDKHTVAMPNCEVMYATAIGIDQSLVALKHLHDPPMQSCLEPAFQWWHWSGIGDGIHSAVESPGC